MTRVTELAEGATELDRVWNVREKYFSLFLDDYLQSIQRVDPVLVELCRLRIAQMVGSDFDQSLRYIPARAAGLTEEKLRAVTLYPTSPHFSSRERMAVEFTEQWVMQSSAISDDDCDRLQQHLSVEEFISFVKALGVMDQFCRANSAFRISPAAEVSPRLSAFFTAHLPAS
jgi:alkylhydroperoxidase family enzyme